MAVARVSDNETILATAGDDGAIAFSRLAISYKEDQQASLSDIPLAFSTLLISKAHASAVTALRSLNVDYSGVQDQRRYNFVTSGNDQMLKAWYIEVDLDRPGVEGFSVRRCHNTSTSVADLAYIEPVNATQVVLAGIGMEIWSADLAT